MTGQCPRIACEKVQYGGVILYKSTCPECKENNLEELQEITCTCCGLKYETTTKRIRVEPSSFRKRPVFKVKKREILARQGNRCYWCNRGFGGYYLNNGKIKQLQPQFDHKTPFAYTGGAYQTDMVAACRPCNSHKHDKMFNDECECKKYLLDRLDFLVQQGKYVFFN